MRLFWAINLPDKIKQGLGDLQTEIKNSFPMEVADNIAKWVAPENLHITLRFLGEVGESHLPEIIENGKKIFTNQTSFSLRLEKVCYGPENILPPRFIWAEISNQPSLKDLAQAIGESDNFFGHITLARIKEWAWKRIDPEEQPDIEKELNIDFQVKTIELMQSVLKRTGPQYTILQSFPLL